jgi:FKBP12-rapamycin complex-associated protein
LKESWYEKLRRWEDALSVYERKQKDDPTSTEYMLGRMRCLHALGEWDRLAQLSKEIWKGSQDNSRTVTAPLAAAAAFNLGEWSTMEEYVGAMSEDTVEGSFFRATLEIHRDNYQAAQRFIDRTRDLLDPELTALVGESYTRAYKLVVRVQQLSELEEIIEYKQLKDNPERQNMIRTLWKRRLLGCQHNVDVWQSLLAVHKLVIPPLEELDLWLKFIGLCRKGGRLGHAQKTLTMLMGKDPAQQSIGMLPNAHPRVTFAYIKQLWSAGAKHPAFEKLRVFVQALKHSDDVALLGRAYLKLGEWQFAMKESLDDTSIPQICASFKAATECDTNWYKAWHAWALINFEVVSHYSKKNASQDTILQHLVTSIQGFFRSIALAPDQSLQDILRLLTLWFQHGALKDVEAALREGFNTVSIDTWLQVIPQIIARIHSPVMPVRRLTQELLASVGKEHPQALVYSLTVASKSQSASRLAAARSIMDKMRKHSATLVDQALMASQELIRVAILWNEIWHEALEEASRLYFGDHNVEGMLATLQPLHAMLDKGPETLREVAFEQAFGRDLQEAMDWCKKYMRSRIESDLHQAWDLYTLVYRKIKKQLPQITTLELQYVSPKLLSARDFELAVPGTYRAGEPIVRISSFAPTLSVFNTKQRPRKLTIHGSDGIEYVFLLKGHEDLRQDERVMQLFGLVNNLLANDHETAKSHLSITRYAVIPLSPNSGLIGWVPHSDTLHTLIKDYRESRKILLDIECRLMAQMSSDYSTLPLLQKVEVFGYALENTNGHDLDKVLWRKSRNSEVWLERRTNYTRSLAVMSMVGYILGLGDRHPSNLMLDRISGRIIHIDFGDCFEVALHRDQYPEKIPFRLTRMLTNAMEVSGIEGNFRITCEAVMNVLRHNKDSLMAVLEAFVHDPLINWRLLTPNSPVADSNTKQSRGKMDNDIFDSDSPEDIKSSLRNRQRNQTRSDEKEADIGMPEVLNERALTVINRVSKKLTGRDFSNEILDVPAQVQRLIEQATSHENLCQCWVGWCPFW